MSQALNCIWSVLSLWAFVHWLCTSPHRRSVRREQLFGLVCVLVLLFPVVSDNDDLLQQELLGAPASPVLKSLFTAKAACENGMIPVGSASHTLFLSRAAQEIIHKEPAFFFSAQSIGATGDRSPPRIS